MTALRREMEAAKRAESRPRDLREAIKRDLHSSGRRRKSPLHANSKSGTHWWNAATAGPTDCTNAQAAIAKVGHMYEAYMRQTEKDLGRRAVDVNLDELPDEVANCKHSMRARSRQAHEKCG